MFYFNIYTHCNKLQNIIALLAHDLAPFRFAPSQLRHPALAEAEKRLPARVVAVAVEVNPVGVQRQHAAVPADEKQETVDATMASVKKNNLFI